MPSTEHQPTPPQVIGRARLQPEHIRHTLALTQGEWYPVIEQPADVQPLEGHVWIDLHGRPQSVWATFLEIIYERGDDARRA